MLEVGNPGLMARSLELDLARFQHGRRLFQMPAELDELASVLARIAQMLRDAEERRQAVDLGDEVVLLIMRFRSALRALGGEPAQA